MATPEQSYTQSVAEERLKLIRDQLTQNYQEDSVIGRSLKELKRKDLKTQVQPLVAQLKLKAGGPGGSNTNKGGAWGGPMKGRGMGTSGASAGASNNPWIGSGWRNKVAGGGANQIHTGSTSIVDKAATWTTEGYIDHKSQPREQAKQMMIKSAQGNIGMVYNQSRDSATGKKEWRGRMMEFGAAGGNPTMMTPEDQKTKGAKILADKFKTRRKEQATPLAPVVPVPTT